MVPSVRLFSANCLFRGVDVHHRAASNAIWRDHAFLIPTTLFTPAMQQLSMYLGYPWPTHLAFVIYFASLGEPSLRRLTSSESDSDLPSPLLHGFCGSVQRARQEVRCIQCARLLFLSSA